MDDNDPNFTVVKSTLNRFCNNDFIKSHLQDYLFQTNLLLNESYLFVNLHVNRILENNLTSNYKTLNETFFNNVFMGLKKDVKDESKRFKEMELTDTYHLYKQSLPTDFQHTDTKLKSQLLTELSLQLSTITDNHLVKELIRWCRVETIDEFNTSKKCSKCLSDTEKMKYLQADEMRIVNDVLRCKNEKCRTYFDRDINGARNMLKKLKIKLGLEEEVEELNRKTVEV